MFWNNFVKLCTQRGTTPTAVVHILGVAGGSVTKWKNGAVPRDVTLQRIADYFGVTVDYLLGKENAPNIKSNAIILDPAKTRMIPVYESVSAGFGTLAQDLIIEYMPLYIHSDLEARDTICIKVKGDSMSPDIEDGDIIQVYKTAEVENGDVAVVLVDGEEALVKKFYYGTSSIELHSINPAYSPIRFERADVARVQVMGVVKNTIKDPKPHHPAPELNGNIVKIADDLTPDEQKEVEKFIAYLKSKRQ